MVPIENIVLGNFSEIDLLRSRIKKSFFSADFSAKNRFSVGLETILGRKNRK